MSAKLDYLNITSKTIPQEDSAYAGFVQNY